MITIFTQCVRPSVRPFQNFRIRPQSLPAGTVGWPSGSLMIPVLFSIVSLVRLKNFEKLKKWKELGEKLFRHI